MYVTFTDGRLLSAPLTERLRQATPAQRGRARIEDNGAAITWDEIDGRSA